MNNRERIPLLFETIKLVNSVPMNLSWHQERVDFAFTSLYKRTALRLQELIDVPENHSSGVSRCRFLYNDKEWSTEFNLLVPKQIKTLKLIDGNGIAYPHKFIDRSGIDLLYSQKGECDDVLIVVNDHITDTSIANIIFSDGKNWFTPSTPLLPGTCRNKLLSNRTISEQEITIHNFKEYSHFMLINALNDYDLNRIQMVSLISDF